MDKNTELRSSLLYFVDEAIGYRHSIHFLHRWIETGEQTELEGLIREVGRENFVDLQPIIDTVKDSANTSGITTLQNFIHINGIYNYDDPDVKITPMPNLDNSIPQYVEGNSWVMHSWVETNTHKNLTPYYSIAKAYGLFQEARDDFSKIFNLLELMFGRGVTLFSAVRDNDIELLGKLLSNYYPMHSTHINRLAFSLKAHPDLNWKDALSRNQVKSKFWLIEKLVELNVVPKKRSVTETETSTLIVGGWVGMIPFLTSMMGKNLDNVINIDIDKTVHPAALELNLGTHNNFKNSAADIRTVDLKKYKKLIVIDTIVEHFENHGDWVKTLPRGTTVVLQGNDMFDVPDHVNCHKTLEDFIESCGLNNIIWSGELNLHKCTRYMAIGTT